LFYKNILDNKLSFIQTHQTLAYARQLTIPLFIKKSNFYRIDNPGFLLGKVTNITIINFLF